jgi:hypothetical protein
LKINYTIVSGEKKFSIDENNKITRDNLSLVYYLRIHMHLYLLIEKKLSLFKTLRNL